MFGYPRHRDVLHDPQRLLKAAGAQCCVRIGYNLGCRISAYLVRHLGEFDTMNDQRPQRGRFQFSLRKLMLWMLLLGAYLGVVRWAGAGTLFIMLSTTWLGCLVSIQIALGPKTTHAREEAAIKSSLRWSGLATVCVTVCLLVGVLVWHALPQMGWKQAVMGPPILGLVLGTFLGILVYFPVLLLVQVVNVIDALMQNKMPRESDEETHDRTPQ